MPQDSLRSRIYKSFLTCNDPKGIVDNSSMVRKQNVETSGMEKRTVSQRTRKKSCDSLECIQREKTATKRIVDEFDSSSSYQLKEVSRGARKLNRTIDSWSNGMKYGRESQKIARDLFEGACDLQESLVILGKLQEASWYMNQVKKKEQRERTCLSRFDFDKPRLSTDYSYRNGGEKLKNMIRDRLAKQMDLFPGSNIENSASETASTSSSQSSMYYNTVANKEKKGNGKNPIAKLMGLEFQSQQLRETRHRRFLSETISDHIAPPIVLLKPLHASQVVEENGASKKKRLTKLKMKEKLEDSSSKRVFGSMDKKVQNLHRKEAIDKKVVESQKEIVTSKNLLLEAKIAPKIQDRKPETARDLHIIPIVRDEFPKENQAIREKVINEVTIVKSVDINFGGQSNDKKPDQTNSPASLLHIKEKDGGSKSQLCGNLRIWISQDESMVDIYDEMESWRNYRKIKEMKSGILGWDWKVLEAMNEAEEVVEDIEKRILVGLIQEVFT